MPVAVAVVVLAAGVLAAVVVVEDVSPRSRPLRLPEQLGGQPGGRWGVRRQVGVRTGGARGDRATHADQAATSLRVVGHDTSTLGPSHHRHLGWVGGVGC